MGFNLGIQVLLAAVIGIFTGIFFGAYTSILSPIGDAYVMLLQMAILPYIPLSLIHGIGSLSPQMALKLFRKGWYFIPLLWALIFLTLYLLSIPIPTPDVVVIDQGAQANSDFFSGLLTYLVPQNPFYDLAHNILPALAVFGLIVGIAMMMLKEKDPILPIAEKFVLILEKILQWLARLSPIAVFVHLAVASGTIHFEELYKLEFYVALVILGTVFLTVWILPKLVASLGPFNYKELLREGSAPCLIAFATGVPSVSFPFMLRAIGRLMHHHNLHPANLRSTSQTVIPLAYSFTQLGNFFLFLFIIFMGFFFRETLSFSEQILLPFLTIILSLGAPSSSMNSVKFLVEHLKWPDRAVDLFIQINAITLNFQVMLSIASVMSFIILVLLGYYRLLKIRWKPLSINMGMGIVLFLFVIWGIKETVNIKDNFSDLYGKLRISEAIPHPVSYKIYNKEEKEEIAINVAQDPLHRILESRILKVGFDTGTIPFCYLNNQNELAGYDIACAFQLASNLDCRLEFVPLDISKMSEELAEGKYDIAMSAVLMNELRIIYMDFSHPYDEENTVLVVPRKNFRQFLDLNVVRNNSHLLLGGGGGYAVIAEKEFPNAHLVAKTNTPEALVNGKIDAVVWSRLSAFAWCIQHPEFVVIDYGNALGKRYFSYGLKQGAISWAAFIDDWLQLSQQSGFIEKQRHYWLQGETDLEPSSRWSIIRNVLHWVN